MISPRVGSSRRSPCLAFSAVAIGVNQIGLAAAPNLAAYIVAWLVIGLGMGPGCIATLGRLHGYGAIRHHHAYAIRRIRQHRLLANLGLLDG